MAQSIRSLAIELGAVVLVDCGRCLEIRGEMDVLLLCLPDAVSRAGIAYGDLIVRQSNGRRYMACIRHGVVLSVEEIDRAKTEARRREHQQQRERHPKDPVHGYYGIAPTSTGKWRAALHITYPSGGGHKVIVGRYRATPEEAARDHDCLARYFAARGCCGKKVRLNFTPQIVTHAELQAQRNV